MGSSKSASPILYISRQFNLLLKPFPSLARICILCENLQHARFILTHEAACCPEYFQEVRIRFLAK